MFLLLFGRSPAYTVQAIATHVRGVWEGALSSNPMCRGRGMFSHMLRGFYSSVLEFIYWTVLKLTWS